MVIQSNPIALQAGAFANASDLSAQIKRRQ
jgi:hypothetical protein